MNVHKNARTNRLVVSLSWPASSASPPFSGSPIAPRQSPQAVWTMPECSTGRLCRGGPKGPPQGALRFTILSTCLSQKLHVVQALLR
jgi:hypothetical protein